MSQDANLPDGAKPMRARRRRRDVVGLVLGVATAVFIVGFVMVAAVGALFVSGFVPLTGLQGYVANDLQKRLGDGWTVRAGKAGIVRADGSASLRIRDAEFNHVSGIGIRAPDADVRYDPLSFLSGRLRISSIDIPNVNLALQVDRSGAISLDTGTGQVAFDQAEAASGPTVIEKIAGALATLLDDKAVLEGLDRVALTNAGLTLVSPDGTKRVGLERALITLSRTPAGRELRLGGATPTGPKSILLTGTRDAAGEQRIVMTIKEFQLGSMERLILGPEAAMSTGFPLNGTVSFGKSINGDLTIGPGRATLTDGSENIAVDRVGLRFSSDAALTRLSLDTIEVNSGETKLKLSGLFERFDTRQWRLSGEGSGMLAGQGGDPAHQLSQALLTVEGIGTERAELTALSLNGPQFSLTGTGRAGQTPDGPEVYGRLQATNSQVRAVLAAWPSIVSPIVRRLLIERVEAGVAHRLDLAFDMPPPTVQAARVGDPSPDESIAVSVAGSGVRFVVGDGMPKLHDVVLTAKGTGRTLSVLASSARIDLPKGRQLQLGEGSFAIADTWAVKPIGQIAFRTQGSVDALATLLAMPALRAAVPAQVDPETVKGRVDLRSTASLPLIDKLEASDVIVQSSGMITGLNSDNLIGREKLEAGNLSATYDRGNLSLRGEARIGGTPAQIEMRQDDKGVGEAIVNMTLDQAARQRRGLGLGGTLSGPVMLRVVKPLGRKPEAPPRFDIDLTRASIDGLLPGWNKPAGRAGRLSFTLDEDDDEGPDLNDVVLDAAPVSVRGSLSISNKGQLQRASFSQFRLSSGDDMRLDLKREGLVSKITIRGQVADARAFLRPLTGTGPPSRPSDGPEDIDVDFAMPILTGFNNEVIGNANLKLSVRGKTLRQLDLTGRIGRSPLMVQLTREGVVRRLKVRSEDGGAFLRYVDLYRRAFGGELSVDARPTDDGVSGDITFDNFRVRGEPALRRVVGEQFAQAQGSVQDGSRLRREANSGDDVLFTRLKGSFVRSQSRFEIRDGLIFGNDLGVSAQGSIDYARDRADIAGTFVPGFVVNNAFSQVPILGPLLGGGRNEGLFAVNFRISGSASAPTMSINPLSALAPGILRRFVDPFGGIPDARVLTPPRAVQ